MSVSVDEAFHEFQRTGEPAALGVVFDGVAAELMRVASHLTQDLHVAEDLVQTTFLVAIERRHAYQPSGSVRGWLLGILVNRARRYWRDARASVEPDAQALSREPGPPDAAEAGELSAAVSDAVAALPEVYRPVLHLFLRHRLDAREIALALERPPGTVRTQLVRGLELLRRALPAGLAGVVAGAMTPTLGLAAMRAAVLEHATRAATLLVPGASAGVLAVTGVLLMKKVVVALLAGIAVLSLLWFAWPRSMWERSVVPDPDAGSPAAAALTITTSRPADVAAAEPERRAVDRSASARSKTGWLRGRCVDEAGRAVPGATIALRIQPQSAEDSIRAREEQAKDPAPAESGADGRFAVALTPADFAIAVSIEAPDRLTLQGGVGRIEAGRTLDLGDVELAVGCRVTGRVVDVHGAPQAGARVTLRWNGWTNSQRLRLWPEQLRQALADARGEFAFRDRLPVGTLQVQYLRPGASAWTSSEDLVIAREQANASLELACPPLDELPSLSGRVVDQNGMPIVQAEIVGDPKEPKLRPSPRFDTRSDAEGRFRIVGAKDVADAALQVRVEKDGFEPLTSPLEHRFGQSDLTLVLQRVRGLEIQVVAQDTGEPVEEYSLRFFLDPLCFGMTDKHADVQESGRHQEGVVTLPVQHQGRHLLVVTPAGRDYAASRFHVIDVGPDLPRQRIELPRLVTATLQVQRTDGSPVAATRVQLIESTRAVPVTASTRILLRDQLRTMTSSHLAPDAPTFAKMVGDLGEAILVQEGVTDAHGRIELQAGARSDYALHVRGPGHAVRFVPRVDLTRGEVLRIEVATGATVEGRLAPPEIVRQLQANVRLISVTESNHQIPAESGFEPGKGLRIEDDGRFVADGVPPGDWRVHLTFVHSGATRADPIALVSGLRTGERRSLTADVGHLQPGRLRARVLLDGALLANTKLTLQGELPSGQGQILVFGRPTGHSVPNVLLVTDRDGAFDVELMPGRYRLCVRLAKGQPSAELAYPDDLVVTSGAASELTVLLRRVRMTVRVVDPAGQPVTHRSFTVQGRGSKAAMPVTTMTDGEGVVILDPAPLSPFHLTTWPEELMAPAARMDLFAGGQDAFEAAMIKLGPLLVPPDASEVTREVRMPAR